MILRGIVAAVLISCAHTSGTREPVVFDSNGNVQSFYGIPFTLTISGLRRLPYHAKMGRVVKEGDTFVTAAIQIRPGISVDAEFLPNGKVYRLRTASPNAVGPKGVHVGSSLSAVKATWPSGKLYYGIGEANNYVAFFTGTNIVFDFDPEEMPREAFGGKFVPNIQIPDLKVKYVRFEKTPIPVQ